MNIRAWGSLWREWRDLDLILLLLPVFLTVIGGMSIYSTELNAGWTDWWQHWFIGAIGIILALVIARFAYDQLLYYHWFTYAITNISLLLVLIIGRSELGAQRWIPILGVNVQPSEFAKLGLIITLAAILHDRPIQQPFDIFKTLSVTVLPWGLIFLQPDLGTALVFAAISLGMLYWGGANIGWLLLLGSPLISMILFNVYIPAWLAWVALIGAIAWKTLPWFRLIGGITAVVVNLIAAEVGHILWGLLQDYQKLRITLFLDPSQDPLGGGYHLIQSRIAIGSGSLWGKGFLRGTQTQLNFIPEQHTDFIFSAIGEEWGFAGSVLILLIFLGICWRLLSVAMAARDNFGSLLAIGVFSMILFQTVVNIGMTIGVAPVTGIPLPWISYGRSALLTNFIALGLVESVALHQRTIKF
ncbi:rod shape-determining protein RodA [Synechococcus sp. PCC 7502]|uniref:rod shape-determining protein RodA n=1 Tax=Synechococcus sp. PCC 7502 TaxID=1173263 RepID=UPI00029FD11C|nr:rod shape-determining protein RodA [Synechococcus sp. PCC 7502]AFY73466.1 rod shape-determining protein RodA [Synechococcus sp. PCC 7502]